MVRCITCNVLHMRQFCRFLYCFAWSDTVKFNRLPCPKNEMYDDAVFANGFRYQLTMLGTRVLIWLSRFFHAHIAHVIDTHKIIAEFFRISYCLLIWYARIQSSAMFKRQDVRWYGFQRSILISIDYVWSVYIHGATSSPWDSYCIWNSSIRNHHW